jgi:hypothetical protein
MIVINLVTPKAVAKLDLLFNKPALDSTGNSDLSGIIRYLWTLTRIIPRSKNIDAPSPPAPRPPPTPLK